MVSTNERLQLTLESDEALALAQELAALTGESVAAAVITALRERLDRERTERDKQDRLARITALAADIRAHMTGRGSDADRLGTGEAADAGTPQAFLWARSPRG